MKSTQDLSGNSPIGYTASTFIGDKGESEPAPSADPVIANIANGASLSGAVQIDNGEVVRAIITPSVWTAASISFDVSIDDGLTYKSLRYPDGTEFVQAVTVDSYNPFPTVVGVTHIKIRSGILGALVAQAASRDLKVLMG